MYSSPKSLFATGNFRDVRVDAVSAGNGVRVTFSLFLNYRIGKIIFDGIKGGDVNSTLELFSQSLSKNT